MPISRHPAILFLLGSTFLLLGSFFATTNIYLALLRVHLHKLLNKDNAETRHVSVMPLVGTVVLLLAVLCLAGHQRLQLTALILIIIDVSSLLF